MAAVVTWSYNPRRACHVIHLNILGQKIKPSKNVAPFGFKAEDRHRLDLAHGAEALPRVGDLVSKDERW